MTSYRKDPEKVDIPFMQEDWMEFREITGGEAEEADLKGTESMTKTMKGMPPEMIGPAMDRGSEAKLTEAEQAEREFKGYDHPTLVRYGVAAWSFDEQCDDAHKVDLPSRLLKWAARIVFEKNVRPLGEAESSGSKSSTDGSRQDSELPIGSS